MNLLGIKVLSKFGENLTSPVMHTRWYARESVKATCTICANVPNKWHPHCGIYAFFDTGNCRDFNQDFRGVSSIMVIISGFGNIEYHEKGFRCGSARVVGVIDYDLAYDFWSSNDIRKSSLRDRNIAQETGKHFQVPLYSIEDADTLVNHRRELFEREYNISK